MVSAKWDIDIQPHAQQLRYENDARAKVKAMERQRTIRRPFFAHRQGKRCNEHG